MRSAAVFFLKRQAMRASTSPRRADPGSRRHDPDVRRVACRDLESRGRAVRMPTRSRAIRARRPRTRPEVLVPRGFVPLRTH
jgi:hypothetical protein